MGFLFLLFDFFSNFYAAGAYPLNDGSGDYYDDYAYNYQNSLNQGNNVLKAFSVQEIFLASEFLRKCVRNVSCARARETVIFLKI